VRLLNRTSLNGWFSELVQILMYFVQIIRENTVGLTAWSPAKVQIQQVVRDLDVVSTRPLAEIGQKGWFVHP